MKGESTVLNGPCDLCYRASQIHASEQRMAKVARRGKTSQIHSCLGIYGSQLKRDGCESNKSPVRLSGLSSLAAGKGRQRAMVTVQDTILRMGECDRSV